MKNQYLDRLQADTYDNGAPCIIGLFDNNLIEDSYIEIFEGLLSRIIFIGKAYNLPILSRLDIYDDIYLNTIQCKNLINELTFIDQIIKDNLLNQQIKNILKLAKYCIKSQEKYKLLISGN